MSGLDDILNMIETQQKQDEDRIIKSAEEKARQIQAEADGGADKGYQGAAA